MKGRVCIAASLAALLIAMLSCNRPVSVETPAPVNPQAAEATPPAPTSAPAVSDTPASTGTPTETPLPSLTPTATYTITPSVVTVSVSGNTNCRTGPGTVYDLLDSLLVGQTAEVVGRDAEGQNWVIKMPSNPERTCWLWGRYATLSGNWEALPIIEPPPTPTPVPSFTFSYDSWGVGPGYQCFKFDVKNTGSVTWRSYTITLQNSAHGTTATGSSDEFIGYDNWCISTGSQSELMPGETGMAKVQTFLAYNPAGETFDVTLKLCSEDGLGGTCKSKTIDFAP
jgi:hypothetical protein